MVFSYTLNLTPSTTGCKKQHYFLSCCTSLRLVVKHYVQHYFPFLSFAYFIFTQEQHCKPVIFSIFLSLKYIFFETLIWFCSVSCLAVYLMFLRNCYYYGVILLNVMAHPQFCLYRCTNINKVRLQLLKIPNTHTPTHSFTRTSSCSYQKYFTMPAGAHIYFYNSRYRLYCQCTSN